MIPDGRGVLLLVTHVRITGQISPSWVVMVLHNPERDYLEPGVEYARKEAQPGPRNGGIRIPMHTLSDIVSWS